MSKPYEPRDRFFQKAKKEGLRARSAYKLAEIQERFRLIRPGAAVLDLGAAPGGFLQVAARAAGPRGQVVGVDVEKIAPLGPNVVTLVADIYAPDLVNRLRTVRAEKFDVVLSDMAPKTSGVRQTDEARSLALCERALEIAQIVLRPGGALVAKVFMGGGFDAFLQSVKRTFGKVKVVRPEATRGRSVEVYVVGQGFRAAPPSRQDAGGFGPGKA